MKTPLLNFEKGQKECIKWHWTVHHEIILSSEGLSYIHGVALVVQNQQWAANEDIR